MPITDTSKQDPLLNLIVASSKGGIEEQEKQGQKEVTSARALPKDCPKKALESLGFVFKDDLDDLFVNVQFPEGWHIAPTDHSMWSELIDDKNRVRGRLFYKASFYDRNAHLHLCGRFVITRKYSGAYEGFKVIEDTGVVVFSAKGGEFVADMSDEDRKRACAADDTTKADCEYWLSQRYPDWKNVLAYW